MHRVENLIIEDNGRFTVQAATCQVEPGRLCIHGLMGRLPPIWPKQCDTRPCKLYSERHLLPDLCLPTRRTEY